MRTKIKADPSLIGRPKLRERDWTDAMIDRFLPEPDVRQPNPVYRSAPLMKLYRIERVEAIEAAPPFWLAQRQAKARKAGARKSVSTKLAKLERWINELEIEIPALDVAELTELACRHYNDLQLRKLEARHWDDSRPIGIATPGDRPEFLARISVNFLRHAGTDYHDYLDRTYGRVGVEMAYPWIKARILDAIAARYPHLKVECERQKGQTT